MALHRLKKLKKIAKAPKEEKAEVVSLFNYPSETLPEPPREEKIERISPPSMEEILEALKADEKFLEELVEKADGKRILGGEGLVKHPSPVKYKQVSGPYYYVDPVYLIPGINIFGVSGNVNTIVYLPEKVDKNKLIYINNEMTNNTVQIAAFRGHLDINSSGDDLLINGQGDRLII